MARTDRLIAEPLYKRAEAAMVARIVSGEWAPGARLPNEFELAEAFGVSQGTVRKALISLEERGLLERSPGRGTTVARATEEESLFAFFRLRDAQGRMATPEPLRETIARRPAAAAERAALQPASAEVYAVERVRQRGGRPLVFERMALPAALFDGIERDAPLPNSLYPYLQDRFGVAIMRAEETLTAALADAEAAEALDVAPGAPLLRVDRRAYDLSDRLVELRHSLYVTSEAGYRVELRRASANRAADPAG